METKVEVSNLISPIIKVLEKATHEVSALLEIGIPEYLENQTEKLLYVNTFLHRAEKVKFDDIYYPVTVKYDYLSTKFEDVRNILEKHSYITIIGRAGTGKSTLVKYIFLRSIRQSYKIPVLVELRLLNEYRGEFKKFIFDKLLKKHVKPSKETLKRALRRGDFLFLFDGFDEIFSKKKKLIEGQLADFVDKYDKNKYIITSRPGLGVERILRFQKFLVRDLQFEDILNFIDSLVVHEERRYR
ncbi:MAG: NACHT domain-containing protein, partial [Bacteroidota bacterium]